VPRRDPTPVSFWVATGLLLPFAGLCVWLVWTTGTLRHRLEATVNGVTATLEIRKELERHAAAPDLSARLAGVRESAREAGVAAQVEPDVTLLSRAAAAPEASGDGALQAADRVVAALRARSREISIRLGDTWSFLYVVAAGALLLTLSTLLLLRSAHRQRRRAETAQSGLEAHFEVLRDVTERWLTGDLRAPLPDRGRAPDAFERALDDLRWKLLAKIEETQKKAETIEELDGELRHQLRERSLALAADLSFHAIREARQPRKGDLLAGRYVVEDKVGAGGMGDVWRVRRTSDSKPLALKVLRRVDDERRRLRFLREAALLTKVRHESVIAIYDLGVSPSGFPYLVTEIGAGVTLDTLRSPLPPDVALRVLRGVAAGLSAIHERGVVHRDLKPSNILVSDPSGGRPAVKIIDFGIARLSEREPDESISSERILLGKAGSPSGGEPPKVPVAADEELRSLQATEEGALLGTPHYIAPEAVAFGSSGPAADIFAFGVTAYRLLTGRMPFPFAASDALLAGRELPPPEPLGERCPELPAETAMLLMRCLSLAPDARPEAPELARRL
jgi:serine/threonine-protein kinase